MIGRRTIFKAGGAVFAGSLMPGAAPSYAQAQPSEYEFSPKDPQFGAIGDAVADDTYALQAAADYCFGPPSHPHGSARVTRNAVLRIPAGNYRITSPIKLAKLHGGRIIGAGRFVTKIVNSAGGPVFVTNGCGYSHFEGLYLESSGTQATVFDLTWDGTSGGAALQSNTFVDVFFSGGAIGVDIGSGGYMGSENLFINCFWINQSRVGLKTSNFNALQNTVIGGNFQGCDIAVWVDRGSVPLVQSVGFQKSGKWDIKVDNSADDTINVIGCRTESSNFIKTVNNVHGYIFGCTQIEAGPEGYFLQPAGCPVTVERCVSLKGQISLTADARLAVRGCSFGRRDWLLYSSLNSGQSVEIEDVQYGGTPNRPTLGSATRIAKQRITSAGVFNYQLIPT